MSLSFDPSRMGQYQITVSRDLFSNCISLYLWEKLDGKIAIAEPVILTGYEQGSAAFDPLPTMTIPPDTAQTLIDSLWDVGLRPSEGSGSAGALLATQEHLKDMRRIAFSLLEKQREG